MTLTVERTVIVQAAPERVLGAFFDPHDLAQWWLAVRSVTIPRPLGTYAVEWATTDFRDELLGRLGGAFHGTVIDFRAGEEFFVGDAFWSPPDGDPIGPMALVVRCTADRTSPTCPCGRAVRTMARAGGATSRSWPPAGSGRSPS